MTDLFKFPDPFFKNTKKPTIDVFFIPSEDLKIWLEKQKKHFQIQVGQSDFSGKAKQTLIIRNAQGAPETVLCGLTAPAHYLDLAHNVKDIQTHFSAEFLNAHAFKIFSDHEEDQLNKICLGWGMAAYQFDTYKTMNATFPRLIWPEKSDVEKVTASLQATSLLRNLINTPSNDLGTDELADVAKQAAKTHKAKFKVIKDEDLLKKNFPMIYTVGQASPRRPQLVDINWGSSKHPKVTIVGKGIIYDTGGLNIKTGRGMRDMKKDMGGAAHALGVAWMIMSLDLPIQLRVLLPIAENAIAGNSYRPGDILQSRKGLSVEIDDTDAEGRLVLADALTYACEEKPDLLIDFATLTGAARVAIGYDVPAFFSNRDEFNDTLRHSSKESDDFVWPFPLWEGYDANINGSVSDVISVGSGRAGHIEAALFLQRFITKETDWIYMDCFAWELNGKPGRPQGGADTGMRAIVDFIKSRYTQIMLFTVITKTADILGDPQNPKIISANDSQMLYGEQFQVEEERGVYVYGHSVLDGYRGCVERDQLIQDAPEANAWVNARASHLYEEPSFKSRPFNRISFLSRLALENETKNGFVKTKNDAWIFEHHIKPLSDLSMPDDIAQTSTMFLGAPYLFAGRSSFGIDCAGLVQVVLLAHGHKDIPRDSKDQQGAFGKSVPEDKLERNDIVFFEGHVGIMMDDKFILNATARHMSTVIEDIEDLKKSYNGIKHVARL